MVARRIGQVCAAGLLAAWAVAASGAPQFADDERARIAAYWAAPGRYEISLPPSAAKDGPWRAGLTPAGSEWLLRYQRAVGSGRLPPTQDASGGAGGTAGWENWVQAKVASDWAAARAAAAAANSSLGIGGGAQRADDPPAPGPIPPGLLAAAGNPPALAAAVAPLEYRVTFDDGDTYTYDDNLLFAQRPRFAYFRSSQGTIALGPTLRQMPRADVDALFAATGMTASEQRVMRAVSALEGGFESVNTYDTGSISVGFIQFVTMADGRHSLLEVMARHKADRPDDFQAMFRRFGVDVSADGTLVVVDPSTGAELVGAAAVAKVIEDKRLTAVFQRAGRRSQPFRIAQVMVAKSRYWPADDPIEITVPGQTLTGRAGDVVKSEAGLATLYDRKVNRGTVAPLADVVGKVMAEHGLSRLADAARYEREIVAALKYRVDFLKDPSLGQPD